MSVPRIVVVFHSYGTCPTQFAVDLSKAMRYSGTIIPYAIHEQSCYVDSARNKLVKHFLGSEGTHMMMVDVDISFEPDAILKTFTILETTNLDLLYGNYALGNSGNSVFGPPENQSKESSVLVGLEPNKVYADVATGGTGWLMARRSLLERMQRECPGPWHWFARDLTTAGDDLRGEDISFGLRVYGMNPKPAVGATTAVLLRHFKTQPFIPEFQAEEARKLGLPALAFPNPFEADKEKYIIHNNHVIDRTSLTPEQLAKVEAEILKGKGAPDAVGRSDEQVQSRDSIVRLEEGAKGALTQASDSDHALGEAQSESGQEGVPAEAEQPQQS